MSKLAGVCSAMVLWSAFGQSNEKRIEAPRFWNDHDLSEWATPVAGLNVRPGYYSEKEYYAAPIAEWVRTYPVYFPGREPAGYWDLVRNAKPEPLLKPGARAQADWVKDGKRVFREMDMPHLRTYDPKLIEIVRSADEYKKLRGQPLYDGTVRGLRWVPTSKGLALGAQNCASCHSSSRPDGSSLDGAPATQDVDGVLLAMVRNGPSVMEIGMAGKLLWRRFAAPWNSDDIHEVLRSSTPPDGRDFAFPLGVLPRYNASPFYPTQVPDLIGIKDLKYIDHTATHRLRGPEDLMRYAALVSCCDISDFGSYRMLPDTERRILYRFPDEVLFALAQYLFSLEPPPNPNVDDPRAAAGKRVFDRAGCGDCHSPPLYTNNKLTRAAGFAPPPDHPLRADILAISVGTDPNLALKTRKGTGLYKVPSLRGVWYRQPLSHDGSVTTLEEWFDPARLRDDYVPSGFKGYRVTHRAVPGHEFALNLNAEDKAALIAFLKTL